MFFLLGAAKAEFLIPSCISQVSVYPRKNGQCTNRDAPTEAYTTQDPVE